MGLDTLARVDAILGKKTTESKKANRDKWNDFYNVPGDGNYIHSHWENFKMIYDYNKIAEDLGDNSSFFNKMLSIMLQSADRHLDYWEKRRSEFIEAAIKNGFIGEKDRNPSTAILEINKKVNAILEHHKLFNAYRVLTNFKNAYAKSDWGRTTNVKEIRNIQQFVEKITENLGEIINALSQINDWAISALGSDYDFFAFNPEGDLTVEYDKKKVKQKQISEIPARVVVAVNSTLSLLNIRGINTKSARDQLEKIQSMIETIVNDISIHGNSSEYFRGLDHFSLGIGRQTPREFAEEDLLKPDWSGILGGILEVVTDSVFDSEGILNEVAKSMGKDDASKLNWGQLLKDHTIVDNIAFNWEIEENGIKKMFIGGISAKSLASGSDTKSYETSIFDYSTSEQLQKINNSGFSTISVLKWMRANVIALNTYNLEEKSIFESYEKSKIQPKMEPRIVKPFLDLELKIAGIMGIPRAFDGIIEYSEEILVKDFNGYYFYTALLNASGKYYWMYDIIEKIIDQLKKDVNATTYIQFKPKGKYTEKSVYNMQGDKNKIENLWKTKENTIQNKKKNREQISYKSLIGDKNLKRQISSLYEDLALKTPITTVFYSIKYGVIVNSLT